MCKYRASIAFTFSGRQRVIELRFLCNVLHILRQIYGLIEVSWRFDLIPFKQHHAFVVETSFELPLSATAAYWIQSLLKGSKTGPATVQRQLLLFSYFQVNISCLVYLFTFSFVSLPFFSSTLCFAEQPVITLSAHGEYVLPLVASYPITNNINQLTKLFLYITCCLYNTGRRLTKIFTAQKYLQEWF